VAATISLDIIARDHASATAKKVGSAFEGSGKSIAKFHGHIKSAARSSVASLGYLAGIAGIGGVVKASMDLEMKYSRTMRLVQASTNAPKSSMKQMSALAMKLGAQTQYSANQAADAMLELGKAGVSTKDIMGGGLKNTLLLASAGSLDLGQAATIASNAMNTFGLHGKDMGKIAAALAGGANASTASVESLGMALSQVGPGAKNAGLNLNQTVGVLAAFDQAGIKGSDAGTSLKTMLARLVPQTKASAKEMKSLGLDFTDAHGRIDSVTTVAQKLHDKLGPLSQAQRISALQTMFGSDATRAATVLMNQGAKGLAKYIRATKDQGAAAKMSKAQMQGTAGAMERLHGAVETAELSLGKALAPTLIKVANYLSNRAVPAIQKFIGQMQSGKGTGGAIARDLGVIFNAAKKVVGIGGKVAHAFDGMPKGLKQALAVGGVGAYAAHKVGVGSILSGAAKTVAKSAVGGVQKVFVVNPGFGKGEGLPLPGGKGGPLREGETAGKSLAAVIPEIVAPIAGIAASIYLIAKMSKATAPKGVDHNPAFNGPTAASPLNHSAAIGPSAFIDGGIGKLGKIAHDAAPATKNWDQAVASLDSHYAHLKSTNPAQAMGAIQTLSRKTGLSMTELAAILPRSSAAFGDFDKGAKKYGTNLDYWGRALDMSANKAQKSRYTLAGLSAMTAKAGISAKTTGKMLHSLPAFVQTAIRTPGMLTSHKSIIDLAKAYHLTPKQVQSIIKLVGARDAQDQTKRTARGLTELNHNNPKPHVTLIDQATPVAHAIQGAINGIHGKSVSVSIYRNIYSAQASHIQSDINATRSATGGYIRGPGSGTSDSIPARLSNGEYVVRAAAVQKYGVGTFERFNTMSFAKGGHVHHGKGQHATQLSSEGADLVAELVKGIRKGHVLLSKAMHAMTGYVSKEAQKVTDLLSARKDFAAGFQGMRSSVFGADYGAQPMNMGTMLAYAKQQQAQSQQLQSDMRMALSKGMSKALVQQFAASGESGIAQLHAIAGTSRDNVAQLNSYDKATTAALAGAGAQAAGAVYNGDIAAAKHNEDLAKRIAQHLSRLKDGHVTVHVHLTGEEIIRSIKKDNKRHGRKSAGV